LADVGSGMRRFVWLMVAVAALATAPSSPASPAELELRARRFIASFGDRVVALAQSPQLDGDERDRQFRALLVDSLDVDVIHRFVLGKHWDDVTPDQRSRFQTLFNEYALGVFSRSLLKNGAKSFTILAADELPGSRSLVHTRIQRLQGISLLWSFRVRENEGQHRIVDLDVDGLSLATIYRGEVDSAITYFGMDALLRILRAKSKI